MHKPVVRQGCRKRESIQRGRTAGERVDGAGWKGDVVEGKATEERAGAAACAVGCVEVDDGLGRSRCSREVGDAELELGDVQPADACKGVDVVGEKKRVLFCGSGTPLVTLCPVKLTMLL